MHEEGRSGIYNATPYRSMLEVECTAERFTVRHSLYGIRGATIIDIPVAAITQVCLRRSIMMLFARCIEVEFVDSGQQRKTLLFGSFKKRQWLAAFAQAGINVLPQQPLRV